MKRWLLFFLCLCLLLCGCQDKGSLRTVAIADQIYTVDIYYQTISDGKYTYSYELIGADIAITYPDGSWYQAPHENGGVYWADANYNDSFDAAYTSGQDLVEAVAKVVYKKQIPEGKLFAGILIIALGVVTAICPALLWALRYGLWFKNAEPTAFALGMTRFSGILCIILGVLFLIL